MGSQALADPIGEGEEDPQLGRATRPPAEPTGPLQQAEDAHKSQLLLDLLPGHAIDLGESLHPLCLHVPLAAESVLYITVTPR